MRVVVRFALCFGLLVWCATAQRGGGGHGGGVGGGGSHGSGGGFSGGGHGGFGGSGIRGGYGGYGGYGGFGFGGYGGFGYGGYGRFGYGGYGRFGYGYGYGYGYPYWGYGWGYPWLGYYDYPYDYYPYDYAPQTYTYPAYSSPNVTVVYPQGQQQAAPIIYNNIAHPVTRSYDQYGQELESSGSSGPASSPIYLIALKEGVIYPATSYQVEGSALHYMTLDHKDKQVALNLIDRGLTLELNRERRVPMNLPQQP
jgi:hypothetical protein